MQVNLLFFHFRRLTLRHSKISLKDVSWIYYRPLQHKTKEIIFLWVVNLGWHLLVSSVTPFWFYKRLLQSISLELNFRMNSYFFRNAKKRLSIISNYFLTIKFYLYLNPIMVFNEEICKKQKKYHVFHLKK